MAQITVSQAAKILGIGTRAVRYHILAGNLKSAVAVTERLYLLDSAEVEKFRPDKPGPKPSADGQASQKPSVRRRKK